MYLRKCHICGKSANLTNYLSPQICGFAICGTYVCVNRTPLINDNQNIEQYV
jgi:hypothetical protein